MVRGGEEGADSASVVSSTASKIKKERVKESHDEDDSNISPNDSAQASGEEDHADAKPRPPIQKRRRVTRACDECRRKKIKCDGKQPCTHCTVYSYGTNHPVETCMRQ